MIHVRLREFSFAYTPGQDVLVDLNLDLAAGERVAVVGESGSGKSTLLRCLNGLLLPDRGTVEVLDRPISRLSTLERIALRRRVGMIFQQFHVHDRLSALDNVLVGRLGHAHPVWSCLRVFSRADRERARECIARVRLEPWIETRARHLSGGQKQRVGIARALAQEPDILLGDEPTANLDVRTSREIVDLLREINEQTQMTLILAMHDLALARRVCDRIIGLRNGRILFDGDSSRLDEKVTEEIFF